MAQVYKKLEIDVNKEVTSIITAVQNDAKSRYLDVVLLDGSTAINLTGHEVRIYGIKGDTTEFYNNGAITNATAGRCQFELTSQALAVANDLEVQIILFKNNVEILSTQPFKIHVVKSLFSSSAVTSSNEYGALVVLYQNLYESYDLMTTMVQNFGDKGTVSTARSITTFWQALEYMAKYMDTNLTTLLNQVLANASVQGVIDRLGATADTGGTATAGTVYAKLNKLISEVKHKVYKHTQSLVSINSTDITVVSVSGVGEFYGLYGEYLENIKVIIDGTEFSNIGVSNETRLYRGSLGYGEYGINGLVGYSISGSYNYGLVEAMPFKSSLVVKVSNLGTTYARRAALSYSLYE